MYPLTSTSASSAFTGLFVDLGVTGETLRSTGNKLEFNGSATGAFLSFPAPNETLKPHIAGYIGVEGRIPVKENFIVGLGGDVQIIKAKSNTLAYSGINDSGNAETVSNFTLSTKNVVSAWITPGIIRNNTLFHGILGASQVHVTIGSPNAFDTQSGATNAIGQESTSYTVHGFQYGAGLERQVKKNMQAFAKITNTQYNPATGHASPALFPNIRGAFSTTLANTALSLGVRYKLY